MSSPQTPRQSPRRIIVLVNPEPTESPPPPPTPQTLRKVPQGEAQEFGLPPLPLQGDQQFGLPTLPIQGDQQYIEVTLSQLMQIVHQGDQLYFSPNIITNVQNQNNLFSPISPINLFSPISPPPYQDHSDSDPIQDINEFLDNQPLASSPSVFSPPPPPPSQLRF